MENSKNVYKILNNKQNTCFQKNQQLVINQSKKTKENQQDNPARSHKSATNLSLPNFSFENAYKMLTARKYSNDNTPTNSIQSERSMGQITQKLQYIQSILPQSKDNQKNTTLCNSQQTSEVKKQPNKKTKNQLPPKNVPKLEQQNTVNVIQMLQNKYSSPVRLDKKLDFAEHQIQMQGGFDFVDEDDSLLEFILLEQQNQDQCDISIQNRKTEQIDLSVVKFKTRNFNDRLEQARKELFQVQQRKNKSELRSRSNIEDEMEIPNER